MQSLFFENITLGRFTLRHAAQGQGGGWCQWEQMFHRRKPQRCLFAAGPFRPSGSEVKELTRDHRPENESEVNAMGADASDFWI